MCAAASGLVGERGHNPVEINSAIRSRPVTRPDVSWRSNQLHVAHAKSHREFIDGDNGGIAMTVFEVTDVLLTEARYRRKLLLRQTPFVSDTPDIFSNHGAHVHAHMVSGLQTLSLSTIICGHSDLSRALQSNMRSLTRTYLKIADCCRSDINVE
jgi:hypothetical protein